jgi:hypothetical protein
VFIDIVNRQNLLDKMKSIIFLLSLLIFVSCKKEKDILVKYEIKKWSGCTQVDLRYSINGQMFAETAVNPDTWPGKQFLYSKEGIYFSAEPTCTSGEVFVHAKINGVNYENGADTRGIKGDPAIVDRDHKFFKDWF